MRVLGKGRKPGAKNKKSFYVCLPPGPFPCILARSYPTRWVNILLAKLAISTKLKAVKIEGLCIYYESASVLIWFCITMLHDWFKTQATLSSSQK